MMHEGRATDAVLQYVSVAPIEAGRGGQVLQTELEDLLHPDNVFPTPRYTLKVTLEEAKQPIVIERNARVSRYNLVMIARYELVDLNSGATVYRNETKRIGSYNASLSDFSTYVAEGDARNRNIKQLANDMVMRISEKLKRFAGDTPSSFALPHDLRRLVLLGWASSSENSLT